MYALFGSYMCGWLASAALLTATAGCQLSATGNEYDKYFDTDRLVRVDIEVAGDDWDAVRLQSRNVIGLFGDECGQHPAESPYTFVSATVTVDGRRFPNVGLRKKGFIGSESSSKPSLKIKFNEYVQGQNLSGLSRMTLNNNVQDPSHMDQCLGYALFDDADVPAPRCGFALVTVNGTSLGIYTHVQSIKKPFLSDRFGNSDGNLYEGTISDFRDGWTATFQRKTNKTDPPGGEDRSDLAAVVSALQLGDDQLLSALEPTIDLDEFYSFWAVETIVSHLDGYSGNSNNYFLYAKPGSGRFSFIPWGADQLFGKTNADPAQTLTMLPRRLFLNEQSRAAYLERYTEILDEVWDDDHMLAEVDRMDAVVAPQLSAAEVSAYNESLANLRAAISGREARLRAELESASTADAEQLMGPICFGNVGSITGTFSAGWNAGTSTTATMTYQLDGAAQALVTPVAEAGPFDEYGRSALYLSATMPDGRTLRATVMLPDQTVAPRTVDLSTNAVYSEMRIYRSNPGTPEIHYFTGGTMTLTAGAAQAGSTWQGSIDLDIWRAPWQGRRAAVTPAGPQ